MLQVCEEPLKRENRKYRDDSPKFDKSDSCSSHTLLTAKKYFLGSPRYDKIITEAMQLDRAGMWTRAALLLSALPSSKHLMAELVEKLRGKSIFKSMHRLGRCEEMSAIEEMKIWSSFCTHVAIEVDHGNVEYRVLLPHIYEKLGSLMERI